MLSSNTDITNTLQLFPEAVHVCCPLFAKLNGPGDGGVRNESLRAFFSPFLICADPKIQSEDSWKVRTLVIRFSIMISPQVIQKIFSWKVMATIAANLFNYLNAALPPICLWKCRYMFPTPIWLPYLAIGLCLQIMRYVYTTDALHTGIFLNESYYLNKFKMVIIIIIFIYVYAEENILFMQQNFVWSYIDKILLLDQQIFFP